MQPPKIYTLKKEPPNFRRPFAYSLIPFLSRAK